MQAYIYTEKGKIEKKEINAPVLDEKNYPEDKKAVILTPLYLSPCSSDVHTVFAGKGPSRKELVLGHEGIARITDVGSMVKDFKTGDIVAVPPVMPDVPDGTGHENSHFSGTKLGGALNGEWAELFKVPDADNNLAFIPEGLSYEAALMAVDVMSTGYTAALEASITPCDDVLVMGSGSISLMAIAAAKELGAKRVYCIGTDRAELNIKLAKQYGCDCYISYKTGKVLYACEGLKEKIEEISAFLAHKKELTENALRNNEPAPKMRDIYAPKGNAMNDPAVDMLLRLTDGAGASRVLICGGDRNSLLKACDMVRYGDGIVVNTNYIEGEGEIPVPVFSLGRGMAGKTFKFMLSKGGRHYLESMLQRAVRKAPDPSPLVTHILKGFDSIPEALELMKERPSGLIKIMVEV